MNNMQNSLEYYTTELNKFYISSKETFLKQILLKYAKDEYIIPIMLDAPSPEIAEYLSNNFRILETMDPGNCRGVIKKIPEDIILGYYEFRMVDHKLVFLCKVL